MDRYKAPLINKPMFWIISSLFLLVIVLAYFAMKPKPIKGDTATRVVSGDNEIHALYYTEGLELAEMKEKVNWLTYDPANDSYKPFIPYIDGVEQYGDYHIYDAETLEELDFIRPSGLEPQTYLLENTEPGGEYLVTLFNGTQRLCFGLRIPDSN